MRSAVRVSHVQTTSLRLSRAPGPLGFGGQQETPLVPEVGPGSQTTPPHFPSLLWAFLWWDRLGRSPNPVLGPSRVWLLQLGEGAGAWHDVLVVCRCVGPSASSSAAVSPSIRFSIPAPLLPRLFPTSCFLPGSGATEGCLEWGRWCPPPPPEASMLFLYHHPSLPIPLVP